MPKKTTNGFKHVLTDNTTKADTAFRNELLEKLPQFFTSNGEFDIEKFRANLALSNVNEIREGYTLNYVGKTYARLQTGQPTKTVIIPDQKHNKLPENADSKNIFLTGDNLDVLKHLQKAYTNRIDFIYIDPPYNTGSDGFVYNDTFSLNDDELRDTLNFTDDEINRLKILNGRSSHSAWLTFMYPRLKIAQQLLKDTGVIFVSIDDNEQANLKLLMDDVFGEGNFVAEISLLNNPKGRSQDKYFATCHEYIIVYSKSVLDKGSFSVPKKSGELEKNYSLKDAIGSYRLLELRNTHREFGKHNRPNLYYPFYVSKDGSLSLESTNEHTEEIYPVWNDGFEGCWTWGVEKATKEINLLIAKQVSRVWKIYRKSYAVQDGEVVKKQLKSIWIDSEFYTERGQKSFNNLFDYKDKIFQAPKSVDLVIEMIRTKTDSCDIVLDFFAGSGTTADAVMQLNAEDGGNRQFILATLDEPTPEASVAQEAGYSTIDEISRERIKRASQKIKIQNPDWSGDSGFRHFYVKEMEVQTMDKIIEFDPKVTQLLPDNMVAEFEKTDLETTGTDTILQTWLINDGYKFDAEVERVHFNQNSGYHIDNRLYIIDEFTQDDIKILLDKIGNSEINISTIIVFGYSISSDTSSYFTTMTGLKNNTKTNLDGVKVEVRY